MSDFERYVPAAAKAIRETPWKRTTFWEDENGIPVDEGDPRAVHQDYMSSEDYDAEARAVLGIVGPLIAEDTRERVVAAAARAVEREQAVPECLTSEDELTGLADRAVSTSSAVAAPGVVLDSHGVPWLIYVTEDGDSWARTVVGPDLPTLLNFEALLEQSGGRVTPVWPVGS